MASWAGVIAAIQSDLTLAAADVNAAFPKGAPFIPAPGIAFSALDRRLRYAYEGDQESDTGGRSLTQNNIQERLTVVWSWPVPNRDDPVTARLELEAEAANRATQKYIFADSHLKIAGVENAIGVSTRGGSVGWTRVGELDVRVLTIEWLIDMPWTEVIGTL